MKAFFREHDFPEIEIARDSNTSFSLFLKAKKASRIDFLVSSSTE